MMPLFSANGMRRLSEIVKPGVLCAFDFDGTLAPIVTNPNHAFLPADILQRLLTLSRYASIAIISGRYLDDLRIRLRFQPHFMLGNHGLEGLPGWEQRSAEYAAVCAAWNTSLSKALQENDRIDDAIWIENKRYSLTVHYRMAENRQLAELLLSDVIARLQPSPRVISGKSSFNVLPQGAANKGRALEQLMRISGATGAIYVGDDTTDEDIFRLDRSDILSVRVERSADSAADFFFERRPQIVQFLDEICRRLRAAHSTSIGS
jgi:trehalose 6-phosphate phosphatase